MPLYEYQCDNGHRFEVIQKFSDAPIATCPHCGAPVHKLLSAPAIQFKGSGWYVTDYAHKGMTGSGKSDGAKESSKEGQSSSSGSDSSSTSSSTSSPTSSKS